MQTKKITVVPNSKKFSIQNEKHRTKIRVTAPPEKNKANKELVKKLSKKLGCKVQILSGHKSRKKTVQAETLEALD